MVELRLHAKLVEAKDGHFSSKKILDLAVAATSLLQRERTSVGVQNLNASAAKLASPKKAPMLASIICR